MWTLNTIIILTSNSWLLFRSLSTNILKCIMAGLHSTFPDLLGSSYSHTWHRFPYFLAIIISCFFIFILPDSVNKTYIHISKSNSIQLKNNRNQRNTPVIKISKAAYQIIKRWELPNSLLRFALLRLENFLC